MNSKYRISIDTDSLQEVLIDYLVNHYELIYSYDQNVRSIQDKEYKEYRNRQMKENRKIMKTLEEAILFFTASDDKRRDLRNRF